VIGRLAKRYARALLELAREESRLEPTGEELVRVVAAFEEPRLRPLLLSPAIDPAARLATSKAVVAALGLSKIVGSLVGLLAERNRIPLLPDVSRWYETLLDEELDRVRVTIRTATPLGAAQRTEVTDLARRLTGRREVLATTEVDADLIGGVVLDVGGTVYDGSIRTQLARLTLAMAESGA
jgi:F-type H+-transporting ATPase subunit delta